jgi:hypothetical protein
MGLLSTKELYEAWERLEQVCSRFPHRSEHAKRQITLIVAELTKRGE